MPERLISVRNKSGAPVSYGLVAFPISSDTDSNGIEPHFCLYQVSLKLPSPNGSQVFHVRDDISAICGKAERRFTPGERLDTSDSSRVPVVTSDLKPSRLSISMTEEDEIHFEPTETQTSTEGLGRWTMVVKAGWNLRTSGKFNEALERYSRVAPGVTAR